MLLLSFIRFAFAVPSPASMADVLMRCGIHNGDLIDGLSFFTYLLYLQLSLMFVFSTSVPFDEHASKSGLVAMNRSNGNEGTITWNTGM